MIFIFIFIASPGLQANTLCGPALWFKTFVGTMNVGKRICE